MSMAGVTLDWFLDTVESLEQDPGIARRLAFLSCPDIFPTPVQQRRLVGSWKPALRSDAADIRRWHKQPETMPVYDTHDLFRLRGWKPTSFDLTRARGCEELLNLCDPLPSEWREQFDLVYDHITNQCFDVAQAFRNTWDLTRPGGWILHSIPIATPNQGFWSASPTVFYDFYRKNGGTIVRYGLAASPDAAAPLLGVIPEQSRRMEGLPPKTLNVVLVQKASAPTAAVSPIMRKFRLFPDSKFLDDKDRDQI